MEKTKNSSQRTKKIVLLVSVLLILALLIGIGGYTYAKYVTKDTMSSTTASVAKWGYTVSIDGDDLFGDAYKYNSDDKVSYVTQETGIKFAAKASGNVVAPGTAGKATISVKGTAEVAAKLVYNVGNTEWKDITLGQLGTDSDKTYTPVKWTLKYAVTDTDTAPTENDAVALAGCNGVSLSTIYSYISTATGTDNPFSADYADDGKKNTFQPGDKVNRLFVLSWEWAFERETDVDGIGVSASEYDLFDTVLGRIANYTENVPGVILKDDDTRYTVDGRAYTYNGTLSVESFVVYIVQDQPVNA